MVNGADILSKAEPSRPVLTVLDSDTIAHVARLMQQHHVGSLIVVDAEADVVGIITERDIITGCTAQAQDPNELLVADIMTRDIVSVLPGASIHDADEIMATHGIRHLPVVRDGKALGMISARDVMAARLGLVQAMKDAAEQIALLSRNVRKLELQEILERLESDVSTVFDAERWCLYLAAEDHNKDENPLIQEENCPCRVETLIDRSGKVGLAGDNPPDPDAPPEVCQRLGASGCHAMVPLTLPEPGGPDGRRREGDSSYLCMCGMPEITEASAEVLRYKLGLVTDILTVNFANARLYQAAYRDPLTGLRTRRAFEEALGDEYSRGLRYGRVFCVAMMDVDNFKVVNDTYGHTVGDGVMKRLGSGLLVGARAHDIVARHGGDEIAVLMPETTLADALVGMERLRRQLEQELCMPSGIPITISCGLAEWSGIPQESAATVVRRADGAMYEAKRAGRNCVIAAAPAPITEPGSPTFSMGGDRRV